MVRNVLEIRYVQLRSGQDREVIDGVYEPRLLLLKIDLTIRPHDQTRVSRVNQGEAVLGSKSPHILTLSCIEWALS
jgi:hypothetical protein